jgi:hypothetical protein
MSDEKREALEAEVARLRSIIESQKRLGKEGPFSYRRSIGRHANVLWNENRELRAKLARVESLVNEWRRNGHGYGEPSPSRPYADRLAAALAEPVEGVPCTSQGVACECRIDCDGNPIAGREPQP